MLYTLILWAGMLFHTPAPADSIEASVVTSDKGVIVSRRDTVSSYGTFSLADALARHTSMTINDNGGPAGLKTASLRGSGSAHTVIYIDGVAVGNVQSGQGDIGMFDIMNASSIVIDYAQNTISINTSRPTFGRIPVAGKVLLSAGSFCTWLPSARLDFKLSDRISFSANASGTVSKGNFPYGDGLERVNNDIRQIRAGLDLFGLMEKGSYHVKAFYNDAERGTPGSLSWPSEDRQSDRNAFVQGSMQMNFSRLYSLCLSAKAAYDDIRYSSSWGDSRYGHTKIQANTAHSLKLREWCTMTIAADIHWANLKSDSYNMSRVSSLTSIASSFRLKRFAADIAVEHNAAFDKGGISHNALSPSASLRAMIAEGVEISALCRRMYRIPDFNELYYAGYGNPGLKPEDAWTADLCIDFKRNVNGYWTLKAKADGFYSLLTDKIISAPTATDPNIWLPFNIGRVRSAGADAHAGFSWCRHRWDISFDTGYSFLSAVDRTPDSVSFGSQIPHTSRHSLSLSGDIIWNRWGLHVLWNLRSGYSDSGGRLPDWNTLNLIADKEIPVRNVGTFTIRVQIKNMTDARYSLVSGYPMPGRSIMGGMEYRF